VGHPEEFLPTFRDAEAKKGIKIIDIAFVYPEKIV
jgi:hypothetical protein